MSTVGGVDTNTDTSSTGSTGTKGSGTLTSDSFMKLMINQLQHQDPLNPTDSNQLLTQLSQISQLQSNTTLTSNLQTMTLQQSIGSAGNLIGKTVQGLDATGNSVNGTVTSVKVQNKSVYLELDSGQELPMENVINIASVNQATTNPSLAAALAALANPSAATSSTTPSTTTPAATTSSSNSNIASIIQSLLGG